MKNSQTESKWCTRLDASSHISRHMRVKTWNLKYKNSRLNDDDDFARKAPDLILPLFFHWRRVWMRRTFCKPKNKSALCVSLQHPSEPNNEIKRHSLAQNNVYNHTSPCFVFVSLSLWLFNGGFGPKLRKKMMMRHIAPCYFSRHSTPVFVVRWLKYIEKSTCRRFI